MVSSIVVIVGVCILLYFVIWLIEKGVTQFRGSTSAPSKTRLEDASSIASNLGGTSSPNLPGDFDIGVTSCTSESNLVCAETVEAVGAIEEGVQSLLEGVGEHLVNVITGA